MGSVSVESRQIDQLKQNVVSQVTSQTQPQVQQPAREPEPVKAEPVKAQKITVAQAAQPQAGVVKIMVCPGCDTENPPSNMYCFNCGKRLKALPKRAAGGKAARTPSRRAPG